MPTYVNTTRHIDKPLSNLAVAYVNKQLIGTKLLPPVPVEKPSDKFWKRNKANGLTAMDLKVSALGAVPELEMNATQDNFSCEDYAITGKVARRDEMEIDAPINMRQDVVEDCTSTLLLKQEIDIASLVTTSSNYAAANTTALAGANRWDTTTGVPLDNIDAYKALIWRAPNTRLVAACDIDTWNAIRKNPSVLERIKGGATAGNGAFVARAAFADYIEVDEFLVAEAWKNTANPGAAISVSRVWPKFFAILAVANSPSARSLHFGSSFEFGSRVVTSWFDEKPGLFGAWMYKTGHSRDEKVVASDAGILLETPIS